MLRDDLKPATAPIRSTMGANGMAARLANIEAKRDRLNQPAAPIAPRPVIRFEEYLA